MKKNILTLMLGILGINVALDIVQVLVYQLSGTVIGLNAAYCITSAILAYIIITMD